MRRWWICRLIGHKWGPQRRGIFQTGGTIAWADGRPQTELRTQYPTLRYRECRRCLAMDVADVSEESEDS